MLMEDNTPTVIANEQSNEGRDIHLYFEPRIGFYATYGLSAFLADHIIDGLKSYSDALQMPVMIVTPDEVRALRGATDKVEHVAHQYYHFRVRGEIGKAGYDKWAKKTKRGEV